MLSAQYSTCAYYLSSTDIPLHAGAIAVSPCVSFGVIAAKRPQFTPLWHAFNTVFLLLIALAEMYADTSQGCFRR
jgi:hypothetical protein